MNSSAIVSVVEAIVSVINRHRLVKAEVLPLLEEANLIPVGTDIPASNAERRKFVIDRLTGTGLSESTARLLLEAGLKLWKKIQDKKAKKAAKKAAKEAKIAAKAFKPPVILT